MMKRISDRNIPLMYLIDSLTWGRFFLPVLALFYIASQVPIEQFTLIMGIFALVILAFEMPSGVIADLLGKKKTMTLGFFLYVFELFLIAFFDGFWIFLIAKITSGIGVSLTSGATEAFVYDTLKKDKREKEHKRISGNMQTIANISMAIVFIIGAYLFTIHYKLPAIVSLPFTFMGFLLTFFLIEPYERKKKTNFKDSYKHLKESLIFFRKSGFVKYITLISLFTGATISIIMSLSSAYFEKIFVPIAFIGIISFVSSLITAFTSKKAHKIEKKLGEKKSLFFIQLIILLGIFSMALLVYYYGFLFYFLIPFVAGFYLVITNDYINQHIGSKHRATLLSVKNFFLNLGIFILFPLVGYLTKFKSMSFSFWIFGLIILVGYFVTWILSKEWKIGFGGAKS